MPCACFPPCPLPKHNSQQPSSIDRENRFPFINARSTYWSCSCHVQSQEIGAKKCLPFNPTVTPVDSMLFTLRDPENKISAVLILSMSKGLSEAFQRFGEVKSCATIFGQQKSRRSPRLGVSLFYGVSAAKWWYFQEGLHEFFPISLAQKTYMTWTKRLSGKHGWNSLLTNIFICSSLFRREISTVDAPDGSCRCPGHLGGKTPKRKT